MNYLIINKDPSLMLHRKVAPFGAPAPKTSATNREIVFDIILKINFPGNALSFLNWHQCKGNNTDYSATRCAQSSNFSPHFLLALRTF